MPGAVLPALLLHWHLSDQRAGALLFTCAIGSSLGALLFLPTFRYTITVAAACTATAALLWSLPIPYPEPPAFLWGLGLGTLMTSISLLHQQSSDGAGALTRLNFTWALGASCCAPLMIHALRESRPQSMLLCLALIFTVYAAGCLFVFNSSRQTLPVRRRAQTFDLRGIPSGLLLGCTLSVAVESACGGWLSTYATRDRDSLVAVIAAPTCLWSGLLLSRSLSWLLRAGSVYGRFLSRKTPPHALFGNPIHREYALSLQAGLIVTAALVIVLSHTALPLLLAAFCMGFGLGPLYPLMLHAVLRQRQTGAIFLMAGLAGSLLPWLTGLVSTHAGSLRQGFLVILAATIVLALLVRRYRREVLGSPA